MTINKTTGKMNIEKNNIKVKKDGYEIQDRVTLGSTERTPDFMSLKKLGNLKAFTLDQVDKKAMFCVALITGPIGCGLGLLGGGITGGLTGGLLGSATGAGIGLLIANLAV